MRTIGQDGTPYYHIEYNLLLIIRSCAILFELEFQGKRYGKVEVKYI